MLRGRNNMARIGSGLFFAILALAQAWFTYLFSVVVTTVSQTEWYTINSRWVYPFLTLASCVFLARRAWHCFRPGAAPVNRTTA